jgi:hypothetical protein
LGKEHVAVERRNSNFRKYFLVEYTHSVTLKPFTEFPIVTALTQVP